MVQCEVKISKSNGNKMETLKMEISEKILLIPKVYFVFHKGTVLLIKRSLTSTQVDWDWDIFHLKIHC